MELVKSDVIFDQQAHTYTTPEGVCLQGITGMLERQLFPDKYSGVPDFVMKRAAERGSFVHEVCELVDDLGIEHEIEEAKSYKRLKEAYGLRYEASEYLVSDNEYFASSIDKVYRESDTEFSLADIKTTYKLDKEYVKWQLSVYAYFFELQNPGAKVKRLFAIWLHGKTSALAEVERIPKDVIKKLLECEINGVTLTNPYAVPATASSLPQKYLEMEQSIIEIESQEKYWKEQKKILMDGIMQEMVKAGAYNWEGDSVKFTRKKESIRKGFDTKAFEKDYPELYAKYITETQVSGSLILNIKKSCLTK